MLDLQEYQIIAQLLDSMDGVISRLEKYYDNNDSDGLGKASGEILDIYNKIAKTIK